MKFPENERLGLTRDGLEQSGKLHNLCTSEHSYRTYCPSHSIWDNSHLEFSDFVSDRLQLGRQTSKISIRNLQCQMSINASSAFRRNASKGKGLTHDDRNNQHSECNLCHIQNNLIPSCRDNRLNYMSVTEAQKKEINYQAHKRIHTSSSIKQETMELLQGSFQLYGLRPEDAVAISRSS